MKIKELLEQSPAAAKFYLVNLNVEFLDDEVKNFTIAIDCGTAEAALAFKEKFEEDASDDDLQLIEPMCIDFESLYHEDAIDHSLGIAQDTFDFGSMYHGTNQKMIDKLASLKSASLGLPDGISRIAPTSAIEVELADFKYGGGDYLIVS